MNFEERLEELVESRNYDADVVAGIAEDMINDVGAYEILSEMLLILSTSEKVDLLFDVAKNLNI